MQQHVVSKTSGTDPPHATWQQLVGEVYCMAAAELHDGCIVTAAIRRRYGGDTAATLTAAAVLRRGEMAARCGGEVGEFGYVANLAVGRGGRGRRCGEAVGMAVLEMRQRVGSHPNEETRSSS